MKYNITILIITLLTICTTNCKNQNTRSGFKDDKKISSPQINPVQIITLKKDTFAKQLITNGKIHASHKADLNFKTNGTIKKIYKTTGDLVSQGDTIAILDREDLSLAYISAVETTEKAKLDYLDIIAGLGYTPKDTTSISSEILSMAKMRSGYTYAQNTLRRAKYDCNSAILCAPFSGLIANLETTENEQAPNDKFCTLIDNSHYNVEFNIIESEYEFIRKNQNITVLTYTKPDFSYNGVITSINPIINENGQIKISAHLTQKNQLLDGMNVKVIIEKSIPEQLIVPRSALVIRDGFDVLFTYTPDGKAHWIYVNIIDKNSDYAIVKANSDRGSKLNEGDKVIVSGNLNLADGSKVSLL